MSSKTRLFGSYSWIEVSSNRVRLQKKLRKFSHPALSEQTFLADQRKVNRFGFHFFQPTSLFSCCFFLQTNTSRELYEALFFQSLLSIIFLSLPPTPYKLCSGFCKILYSNFSQCDEITAVHGTRSRTVLITIKSFLIV